MMTHFNSESLYYLIACTVTIGTLSYKVGKAVFHVIKKELVSLQEDRQKLRIVFQEMTPNHGGSIKDKVNSLEKCIKVNNEMTEKIFVRQRWLMERQNLPVFEADENGLFTWVNEEFAHIFGKSTNLFLSHGWKTVIYNDDREKVEARWNQCIEEKIPCEINFRVWVKDQPVAVKLIAHRNDLGYIGSIILIK